MIQPPAFCLSNKTLFNSRVIGTVAEQGKDVLDVARIYNTRCAFGTAANLKVSFYAFMSEGLVWLCLTGNPARDESTGIINVAHTILFVYFLTLFRLGTFPFQLRFSVMERE